MSKIKTMGASPLSGSIFYGTPAPNGLIDLWGQAWFVDQGERLGRTYGAFTSRWFNSIQFPGQQWSKLEPWPFAQEQMQAALADVTISLDAADWFDIKEPIHNVIRVELPAKAMQQYQAMEKEMFLELEGNDIEAPNAAAKTVKCLQLASGAIYTDDQGNWQEIHDGKLQALESVISESVGMPVLVAYHWKHDLARLLKAFPKGRHLDDDPQTLRDWNAGKIPVLFALPHQRGRIPQHAFIKRIAYCLSLQLQVVSDVGAIHVHAIGYQFNHRRANLVGYKYSNTERQERPIYTLKKMGYYVLSLS